MNGEVQKLLVTQSDNLQEVMNNNKDIGLEKLGQGIQDNLPYYEENYGDETLSVIGQALENITLNDTFRLNKAEELLGIKLTDEQESLILDVHNIGEEGEMAFTYSKTTRIKKIRRLIENGVFTKKQARLLLDYCICGKTTQNIVKWMKYVRSSFFMHSQDKLFKEDATTVLRLVFICAGGMGNLATILEYLTKPETTENLQARFIASNIVLFAPTMVSFLFGLPEFIELFDQMSEEKKATIYFQLALEQSNQPLQLPSGKEGEILDLNTGIQKLKTPVILEYKGKKIEINQVTYLSGDSDRIIVQGEDQEQYFIQLKEGKIEKLNNTRKEINIKKKRNRKNNKKW